jgi:TATA-binding protein-associated factor Taf7
LTCFFSLSFQTIEQVETAVEKLLEQDAKAEKVQFGKLFDSLSKEKNEFD